MKLDTVDIAEVQRAAPAAGTLLCSLGYTDDHGQPHACDKPAPYIWGGQEGMFVMSLCKQHLMEQYHERKRF